MKLSMRLKYMWAALIDVICTIGGFLLKVGVPVVVAVAYIYIWGILPWWIVVPASLVIILGVYLWVRADIQYKEDYKISKDVIYDKYHNFTDRWMAMERGGQPYNVIYTKMTPLMDEFEALVEYHKKLYGEDDTYKLYCDRIDKFIKCQEKSWKNRKDSDEGVFLI